MDFFYRYYRKYKLAPSGCSLPLWVHIFLPVIGFLALVWFLVRVIPKPSRATYPCQRIAFPLASGFIVWLIGIIGALSFLKKARHGFRNKNYLFGVSCFLVGVCLLWICLAGGSHKFALAQEPVANQVFGDAKGIYPGRVVWIHDPNATTWDGPAGSDGYSWQPENTVQKYVDTMVSKAVRELAGRPTNASAWDALFRHFNSCRGRGDVGYAPGEKITIKINLTTCNTTLNSVDATTYNKKNYLDRSDTNPQMILSVLRQLVYVAGVEPNQIAVGDTLVRFPNQWRDLLVAEFPEVICYDKIGGSGRTQSTPSEVVQHWSHGLAPDDFETDFIPTLYADAEYLINIAVLKSHSAGITLCAKNHYGSYNRTPVDTGYYNLHDSLPAGNPAAGQYRALVDIMGHPEMGGKTLLYLVDGLYGGDNWDAYPRKFLMDPFNNAWPSSILASQDPVAIDSVGLDILWAEGWERVRDTENLDDYLFEAALANDPPSGVFYDPDGDGVPLQSLGVHERWNNPIDRQYTRNLGTDEGIELVYDRISHVAGDLNGDAIVDLLDVFEFADNWLWTGRPGSILEDCVEDGIVNLKDFAVLTKNWTGK